MTNPNTDPDALERLLWEEPPADCKNTCEWMDGHAMRCHDVIRVLAAEAAQAQAQSGEWVMVPREPTEWMLQAAEDAVNAAAHCESTTDDLSAIAYKAALAAAPQQAAKPVGNHDYPVGWAKEHNLETLVSWCKEAPEHGKGGWWPLYTHPQPAQDAKDAARYRWLREHHDSTRPDWHVRTPTNDAPAIGALDAAIDAAMAKESGR